MSSPSEPFSRRSAAPRTGPILEISRLRRRIRWMLVFFMLGLIISGLTAIPLQWELDRLTPLAAHYHAPASLITWLRTIQAGLHHTYARYPFMAYGTDWLAFGHFVIAIAFIGPWRDPVRNEWVIDFGLIACLLVIPYAFLMGAFRGIPLYWRLIDASFGILGMIPLWCCKRWIAQMNRAW